MTRALVHGLLAGLGIAVPVGAISVLIVETGIRCGFRCAAAAGAGAATADLIYSAVAVTGGAAVASAITAVQTPLRYASAAVLVAIAAFGLSRAVRPAESAVATVTVDRTELLRTYRTFIGMTIVNPLTVVYFTVFVIGSGLAEGLSAAEGTVFVVAAFAASLSWQTVLAAAGGVAHTALSPRLRTAAGIAGNLIVVGLALVVALR